MSQNFKENYTGFMDSLSFAIPLARGQFGENRIRARQLRGILLTGIGLHGADLHYTVHVPRILHGVKDHRQAQIRMSDHVDLIYSEMPAHRVQIIHIIVDASGQFGRIADGIRPAAIAQVVIDQSTAVREALEIVEQMKPVGDGTAFGPSPTR